METTSGVMSDHTHLLPLLRSFSDQTKEENIAAIAGCSSINKDININEKDNKNLLNDNQTYQNEDENCDEDFKYPNIRVINETDV
jgi:hypothetical protein